MKHVVFILTMPGVGSWNRKWTGADKLYCRTRSYPFNKKTILTESVLGRVLAYENRSYDFCDGWIANVRIMVCTAQEKKNYDKKSQGFCGYEWMIDEIEKYKRILTKQERDKIRNKEHKCWQEVDRCNDCPVDYPTKECPVYIL